MEERRVVDWVGYRSDYFGAVPAERGIFVDVH